MLLAHNIVEKIGYIALPDTFDWWDLEIHGITFRLGLFPLGNK